MHLFFFFYIIIQTVLINANICIYSNNAILTEFSDDLTEIMNTYINEMKYDPYGTFFGKCRNANDINNGLVVAENVLGMKVNIKFKNKLSNNKKKRNDLDNNTQCIHMVSTSPYGNPYSRELTGRADSNIHIGFVRNPVINPVISKGCEKNSGGDCQSTVTYSLTVTNSVGCSYTDGTSNSVTVVDSNSESESTNDSISKALQEAVEKSVTKTETKEDALAYAKALSDSLTKTQEEACQKFKGKEEAKGTTTITLIETQSNTVKVTETQKGSETQTSTARATESSSVSNMGIELSLVDFLPVGINGGGSKSNTKGETVNTLTGNTVNFSTSDQLGQTFSNGLNTEKSKLNTNSESTTDINTDSIAVFSAEENTTTNTSTNSNSVARLTGSSTTNIYTGTNEIGLIKANEHSNSVFNETSHSVTNSTENTISKTISITETIRVEEAHSCDFYSFNKNIVNNSIYRCENENYESEKEKYSYFLVRITNADIKRSILNEENDEILATLLSGDLKCLPRSSLKKVEVKIEDHIYDLYEEFGINPNSITGLSNICSDINSWCDEDSISSTISDEPNLIATTFTYDDNDEGNFIIKYKKKNIWQTHTYGFNDNKPYFRINYLGHGNIVASNFLGYSKNEYGEEFEGTNYFINPDFNNYNTTISIKLSTPVPRPTQTTTSTLTLTKFTTFLETIEPTPIPTPILVQTSTSTLIPTPVQTPDELYSKKENFDAQCYSEFAKFILELQIPMYKYNDDIICDDDWECNDVFLDMGIDLNCHIVCINKNYLIPNHDYNIISKFYDETYLEQYNELLNTCDCGMKTCVGSYYSRFGKRNIINNIEKNNIKKFNNIKKVKTKDNVEHYDCDHWKKCYYNDRNSGSCKYVSKYISKCLKINITKRDNSDIEVIPGEHVIWSTVSSAYQNTKVGFGNDVESYRLIISYKRVSDSFESYTFNGLSLFDQDKVMIWASTTEAGDRIVDKRVVNGFYLPEFYGYPFLNSSITQNVNKVYKYDAHAMEYKCEYINNNYMLFNGCFHYLKSGEGIRSQNKRFSLILQDTGNLIFKDNKVTIWESKTANIWYAQKPYTMHLHTDGTLQILDKRGYILFRTNSASIWNENKVQTEKDRKDGFINYRLEVLNSGTFRIMDRNGNEIWNMWRNKNMSGVILYNEANYMLLCDQSYRVSSLTYLDSSNEILNHMLIGETLFGVEKSKNITDASEKKYVSSAAMKLGTEYIYYIDINNEEYNIMNPITSRNPRIVEARLSDEGEFAAFDAYNNKLFTSGITGPKTKSGEAYYMVITRNYNAGTISYAEDKPSYITIVHNTTNDVLWSYPPFGKTVELNSDSKESYIVTLDGLIYNKETGIVVDEENASLNFYTGTNNTYHNMNACLLLLPNGAYAYGDNEAFFKVSNSRKLYLNENDGGIYIDDKKFEEIPQIKNLPSRLYCDIADNNFIILLDDAKNNTIWEYPSRKKYSISNIHRNNTLYLDNHLWYTPTKYCLTFDKYGLHINNETITNINNDKNSNKAAVPENKKPSTISILSSKNGSLFMIDPVEGSSFNILDHENKIEDHISINNPLNHKVIMKCISETSLVIVDAETNNTLWSYPATQYDNLVSGSKLYLNQQLVEINNGKKTCLDLKEDGIYMHGYIDPYISLTTTLPYIIISKEGILDNNNNVILGFGISESEIKNENSKLTLYCETLHGEFGITASLDKKVVWRYPSYKLKKILRSDDILYNNEILYDEDENICIKFKDGILYFNGTEPIPTIKFDNKILNEINYLKLEKNSISVFSNAKVKLGSVKLENKDIKNNITASCYISNGVYSFNIENIDSHIILRYPPLIDKYILHEDQILYQGETLYFNKTKEAPPSRCLSITELNIYALDGKDPIYTSETPIEYIRLTRTSLNIKLQNSVEASFKGIKNINDSKVMLSCRNIFSVYRVVVETDDNSKRFWTIPEYIDKTSISSLFKGESLTINNSLLIGERLVFKENNNETCLLVGKNKLIFEGAEGDKFLINNNNYYENGFQLYIRNDNMLVMSNGVSDIAEIIQFQSKKHLMLECEKLNNKNAIIVRDDDKKIVYVFPEKKYNSLISTEGKNTLSLYDKLVDIDNNLCIIVQEDGIYGNNSILLSNKFKNDEKIKYIYMDPTTGNVMFNNNSTWLDFSDTTDLNLPTKMECKSIDKSTAIEITDANGTILYYKVFSNENSKCNDLNYISTKNYNHQLCPGNSIMYGNVKCLHYNIDTQSIVDGNNDIIFNAESMNNLEFDTKNGNLKLGEEVLLSFSNFKMPLKMDCKSINGLYTTYIEDANKNILWMHRQNRICERLDSDSINCKSIYLYEYVYNRSGKQLMHFVKNTIESTYDYSDDYQFKEGTLYIELDNGTLKSNLGTIFETTKIKYPPYSMNCKYVDYLIKDKGEVCFFTNVYGEKEFSLPSLQRRNRPIWGIDSINSSDDLHNIMEYGDILDCNTYGLVIRNDGIYIKYYDSDKVTNIWQMGSGNIDYGMLNNDGTFSIHRSNSVIENLGVRSSEELGPYTMKCSSYQKIGVYNRNMDLVYSLPLTKTYSKLDTNSSYKLEENTKLCTNGYCCLSIINNVVSFIDKNNKEKILSKKESVVSINKYGQLVFSTTSKVIGKKNTYERYIATCAVDDYTITIRNSNDKVVNKYPTRGKYVQIKATNGSQHFIGVAELKVNSEVVMKSKNKYNILYSYDDGTLAFVDVDNSYKVTNYCLSIANEMKYARMTVENCNEVKYRFFNKKNIKSESYIEIFHNDEKPVQYYDDEREENVSLCITNSSPLRIYGCLTPSSSYESLPWVYNDNLNLNI